MFFRVFLVFLGDVWATPAIRHVHFLRFAGSFISAYSSCRIMLHKQKSCCFWIASHSCSLLSICMKSVRWALCYQLEKTVPFCYFLCSPAITAFRSESVTLYFSWHVQKNKQHQLFSYLPSRLLLVVVLNLLMPLERGQRVWGKQ